jgi:hypothetical protein
MLMSNEVHTTGERVHVPALPLSYNSLQRPPMTSFPGRHRRRKKRIGRLSPPRRIQLACLFLLLVVCLSGSLLALLTSLVYGPLYSRDKALVHAGVLHLHSAQHMLLSLEKQPFHQELLGQAQQEFMAAAQDFTQLHNDIKHLPPFVKTLPFVGGSLLTANHLALSVSNFSLAGSAGCHLLQTFLWKLHNPLNQASQGGLTSKDMASMMTDFHSLDMSLQNGLNELDLVGSGNLQFGAQVDAQIALLQQYEPRIRTWLQLVEQAVPLLPQLVGIDQPAHYLVEVLDSSELRPTGGFIGNYGFVTLAGGRLQALRITDVDLLDLPFEKSGGFIPFPPEYRWFPLGHGQWSFRDSNLDADFPTSASFGLRNFELEGGSTPVQGVIAITPALMQNALKITGPVAIPDYNDTVSAQNLIERIHYYQLGAGRHGSGKVLSPDGLSSQRKHFTALLAHYFFFHLSHLSNANMAKVVHLLLESVQRKDIQLYFPQPELEALLSQVHIDGRIEQAPDGLFVVDANINGNKANTFIHNTVTDVVTIDDEGNATHTLTLRYTWASPGDVFGNPLYRDYIQVYMPPGSQPQEQQGWDQPSTVQRSNLFIWTGILSLSYGETRTVLLSWVVPHAVQHDGQGGLHFRYLVQRQAGIERTLHLLVKLPACAVIQGTSGAAFTYSDQTVWLTQKITQNQPMSIDYTCS